MRTKLTSWRRVLTAHEERAAEGQAMVELALMLVLVVIVSIAIVTLVGDQVLALWSDIQSLIGGALGVR